MSQKTYTPNFDDIQQRTDLTLSAKLLFCRLARFGNSDSGGQIYPKWRTLQSSLRLSRATIARRIAELKGAGLLETKRGQRGCHYFLRSQNETSKSVLRSQSETSRGLKMRPQKPAVLITEENLLEEGRRSAEGSPPLSDPEETKAPRKPAASAQAPATAPRTGNDFTAARQTITDRAVQLFLEQHPKWEEDYPWEAQHKPLPNFALEWFYGQPQEWRRLAG